jgi:transcriptional regulator with XRE-family HTH domain
MKFGKRLQELREKAGLTQGQLAEASGLALGSIRNYEQGHRDPLWQALFKLARALGVSCEAFKGCVDDGQAEAVPAKKKRKGK